MRTFLFIAFATLTSCAEFPDFDDRIGQSARNATYPTLQPLDPLIAAAASMVTSGQITPASQQAFNSRITALRAKASQLRGPIIDAGTRARMRRGVAVPVAIR